MQELRIIFNNQSATIPLPVTIQDLNQQVHHLFNVKSPSYSYIDEDSELISVDIQLELNEAIRFLSQTSGHLLITEKAPSSDLQFIDDLPLLRSQITTDEGPSDPPPQEKPNLFKEPNSEALDNVKSECSEEVINEFAIETVSNDEFEDIVECKETVDVKNEEKFEFVEENKEIEEEKREDDGEKEKDLRDLIKDEEFPEIFVEKEEVEVDIEALRNAIRQEIGISRSGMFVVHDRMCSNCKVDPVVGPLYKCKQCYYVLCEGCEEKVMHQHVMLKLKEPEKIDRVSDMTDFICRQINHRDSQKVREVLIKNNLDYNGTINYLLGII